MDTPVRWAAHWIALLALLMAALCPSVMLAADVITVQVDRIQAPVGEPITLTVKVGGRLEGQLSLPDLPDYVLVRGPSQRSVTNIVNFQVQRYTEFTYSLVGRRPGTFKLGPVTAQVDGKPAVSAPYPFEITLVTSSKASPETDVFVEASVEPSTAYPGQQVMYVLRIYRAVQVLNYRYSPPSFEGFLEEPMEDNAQTETTATVAGRQYVVKEVRHALFPTRPGKLEVGAASLLADVVEERSNRRRRSGDPFDLLFDSPFGTRTSQRELVAPPVPVTVKPLPAGAPDDFYGLVGDFSLRWALSDDTVAQGESTTLTIQVEGTGNVRDIESPALQLDGFKTYVDNPTQALAFDPTSRQLKGKKQFKVALIPLKEGSAVLPAAKVSFFDPVKGRYRTASTRPLSLNVTPGTGEQVSNIAVSAPARDTGRGVEVVGEDILPLKAVDAPEGERIFGPGHPLALGLFFAPPLAWLMLLLGLRWRARDSDPTVKRQRQAGPLAREALKQARDASDSKEALRQIERAIVGFVADRLGLEGRAMTPQEAHDALIRVSTSEALASDVRSFLQTLEQAQFMPAGAKGAAAERCDEAEALLNRLDKEVRR